MIKLILSLILAIMLYTPVFGQETDINCKTFELISTKDISRTIGGGDLSIDSFYYRVKLYGDSTFEYMTYQKTKEGENIDSLNVQGRYQVEGKKIIFINDKYFKDNSGIKWILKANHILVKGLNTRRTKLELVSET